MISLRTNNPVTYHRLNQLTVTSMSLPCGHIYSPSLFFLNYTEGLEKKMPANIDHRIIKNHQPCSPDIKIWRYLDFPKLIDLLQTRTLHFSRLDTLPDPFEGHVPAGNHALSIAYQDHEAEKWRTAARRSCAFVNCLDRSSVRKCRYVGAIWFTERRVCSPVDLCQAC